MSEITQFEFQRKMALALSRALREEMEATGMSSRDLEKITGISASHIRKMSGGQQEPRLSSIALIEHACNWEPGVVVSRVYPFTGIETLLKRDPLLVPVLRQSAVEHYRTCVKLSSSTDND